MAWLGWYARQFIRIQNAGTGHREAFYSSPVRLFDLLCVAGLALAAFFSIGTNQLSPHRVTVTLAGKVLSSEMVTNPEYVTFTYSTVASTNGLRYVATPTTNYYWRVWPIFK